MKLTVRRSTEEQKYVNFNVEAQEWCNEKKTKIL